MARTPKTPAFNAPFQKLGKSLKKELKRQKKSLEAPPPPSPPPKAETPEPSDDASLFLEAAFGATPLEKGRRLQPKRPPPRRAHELPVFDEDAEVLAELASLIDGTTRFDIEDSDEYLQGIAEGLDRRLLQKLKRGDYAVQAHLDLHGLTREPARDEVVAFIDRAQRAGYRCVRIVHGRGLNSKDRIPVLKLSLKSWLERGRVAKAVLAFCSARPQDGGSGAVYVLLRKR